MAFRIGLGDEVVGRRAAPATGSVASAGARGIDNIHSKAGYCFLSHGAAENQNNHFSRVTPRAFCTLLC
jgi:hypothetical protein